MMKKTACILMTAIMVLFLAACGQADTSKSAKADSVTGESMRADSKADSVTGESVQADNGADTGTPAESAEESTEMAETSNEGGKALIVYFSWSSSGNTEKMASYIQEQTNGDLLEIEPQNPYPADYEECVDVALEERDENVRPEIANLPDSIEEYDTIFIGYPIWWHTAPMIIGTFLENYDLSGVHIYPFTQSASMNTEQFENSMKFVRESAVGANVHDGLFTKAADTESILDYLTENGFVE